MKESFIIPEYDFQILFSERRAKCIDNRTKEVVTIYKFKYNLIHVSQTEWNSFEVINENGFVFIVVVGLAHPSESLKTKAQYVLDLQVISSNRGFYFGLYEIGEFQSDISNQLSIVKSFEICHVKNGWVSPDEEVFITLRENETPNGPPMYFFVKLNWASPTPIIIWKKRLDSLPTAFLVRDKRAFLALKNGSLELWDIEEGVKLNECPLFTGGIASLVGGLRQQLIVGSLDGKIAVVSEELDVLWTNTYTNSSIDALYLDEMGIYFLDYKGSFFHLNYKDGTILDEYLWNSEICSNVVSIRDWFIVSSGKGLIGRYRKEINRSFPLISGDYLIRRIIGFREGFLVGDDDGRVNFCQLGQFKVIRLRIEKLEDDHHQQI